MKINQLINRVERSSAIRSQVILTKLLRKMIDERRRLTGETLSAYLRKAALMRILAETEEEKELAQLAKSVIGSLNLKRHPEWQTAKRLKNWLREIRGEWQ